MTDTRNRYVRLEPREGAASPDNAATSPAQLQQSKTMYKKAVDPASMHHDGSFSKYMEFKNLKLHEQFEAQVIL